MKAFLMTGYEYAASFLPFLAALLILRFLFRRGGKTIPKSHCLLALIFGFYICGVFDVTNAGTLWDLHQYGLEIRFHQVNLIPFSRDINRTAYVLNMIMLMPLGFLLPLIWPKANRLLTVLISGFSLSFLIEVSQLFNNRATDVDDLIMNTMGALAGLLFYRMFAFIRKRRPPKEADGKNQGFALCRYEPAIYVGVIFLGRFLLYNGFGTAKLLYQF